MDEDIFGETPIVEEQVAAEPEAVEPEPVAEQPAELPADPEPPVASPEPAKPEPGFVPLAAVLDERDRRRQLEAELARYQAQQEPQEPLDMYDPEQMAAYHQQQVIIAKLELSEDVTRDKFGDEVVDKAAEWLTSRLQTNPAYKTEVLRQRNPWKYVVEQYQRDQIASQVSLSDFEQFKAWQAAQSQLAAQQPAPVAETPIVQPPRSLASAPSAGSSAAPKPQPEVDKLNSMFGAT